MSSKRNGFTLVEMLVSITIFVILAALAIGSFTGVSKADRVSAGAQQVKGWFEHARSMAIHDKETRGLRFLPDPNNPRLCTGVVYLGTTGFQQTDKDVPLGNALGTGTTLRNIVGLSPDGLSVSPVVWQGGSDYNSVPLYTSQTAQEDLMRLYDNGQLTTEVARKHFLKINLFGQWLQISEVLPGNPIVLKLGQPLLPVRPGNGVVPGGAVPPGYVWSQRTAPHHLCGQAIDYKLFTGPAVLSQSGVLPRGVCIDLDASQLPNRPALGTDPYAPIDLMMSPTGTLIGSDTLGVLKLCISTIEDAEAARLNAAHPVNGGTGQFALADPATAQRMITLIPNGTILGQDVDTAPGDVTPGFQNDRAVKP